MKRLFLVVSIVGLLATSFTSCREKTTEEKVEDAVEDVADDVEDAVD